MVASGYSRTGTGTWHNDFAVPLTLNMAVDEGDPWAASAAPQLQSQLESAGFAVSLTPAASAAAAGELLSDGSADLALMPRTTSPFLSETVAWYSDLLGPPGQNGSQNWTNYDDDTFNNLVTKASQQLNPTTAATDYQAADVAAVERHGRPPALHRADGSDLEPQGRRSDADADEQQPAVVRPVLGRPGPGVHEQHHPVPAGPLSVRRSRHRSQSATRYALGALLGVAGQSEWRNRQTRQLEGLVPARAWGFKSPLRHQG